MSNLKAVYEWLKLQLHAIFFILRSSPITFGVTGAGIFGAAWLGVPLWLAVGLSISLFAVWSGKLLRSRIVFRIQEAIDWHIAGKHVVEAEATYHYLNRFLGLKLKSLEPITLSSAPRLADGLAVVHGLPLYRVISDENLKNVYVSEINTKNKVISVNPAHIITPLTILHEMAHAYVSVKIKPYRGPLDAFTMMLHRKFFRRACLEFLAVCCGSEEALLMKMCFESTRIFRRSGGPLS